jgi:catechol 2,3-dioxygenase-like lactoylglutathione lyase family enzyme
VHPPILLVLAGRAKVRHSGPMPLRTKTGWFGVVLDAPDARELAHFYRRLLGWTIFNESDGWVDLAPSEDAGYNLAFATEKDYARPVWPTVDGQPQMSMHLDIEVDDLEQAVAYAVEVGAEQASYQPQDNVRVMLDPAGHPFCLYRD